ncbi:MAG: UDP-N-acetylglucosamine--N-acetylmuramyl-(pentapeptide) pyrophosphoryl-undecaprenol N-acetylglucosamine transferase [Gemmatimonadales bacterium]
MTARPVRLLIAGGGTGGHLMPALAIADAVRALGTGWQVSLVGAERGVEATLLPRRDFPYTLLPFEPIYRRQWWKNLRWPVLAVRIWRETARLLDRERPDLVLGTGGYASGPVVWLAARRRVRTAILEQDAFPGLVTRWLAGRVDHLYLGAPEAERHLRPGRTTRVIVTGSPIAVPTPERRAQAAVRLGLVPGRPVVLIMGGSQGSLAINELVASWLARDGDRLAERVHLIWASGRGTWERFQRWHRPPAVHVVDFLDPVADGYAVADLVVGRAGMMTLAEVCAWGIPSVLIPLPTAAADHQSKNAAAAAADGAAVHLPQAGLDVARFAEVVLGTVENQATLAALRSAAIRRGKPAALATIVDHLRALAGA